MTKKIENVDNRSQLEKALISLAQAETLRAGFKDSAKGEQMVGALTALIATIPTPEAVAAASNILRG